MWTCGDNITMSNLQLYKIFTRYLAFLTKPKCFCIYFLPDSHDEILLKWDIKDGLECYGHKKKNTVNAREKKLPKKKVCKSTSYLYDTAKMSYKFSIVSIILLSPLYQWIKT